MIRRDLSQKEYKLYKYLMTKAKMEEFENIKKTPPLFLKMMIAQKLTPEELSSMQKEGFEVLQKRRIKVIQSGVDASSLDR